MNLQSLFCFSLIFSIKNKKNSIPDSTKFFPFFRYLDAALDPTRIRPQDVRTIISEIAGNPSGFVVAWRHFQMHWEQYLVSSYKLFNFLKGGGLKKYFF